MVERAAREQRTQKDLSSRARGGRAALLEAEPPGRAERHERHDSSTRGFQPRPTGIPLDDDGHVPHQATSTPTTTGERRAASGDQRGHVKRRTGTTASGDTQLELVVGAQIDVGRGVTTTNNDQQGQPRVSVEPGVLDPLEQPDPA